MRTEVRRAPDRHAPPALVARWWHRSVRHQAMVPESRILTAASSQTPEVRPPAQVHEACVQCRPGLLTPPALASDREALPPRDTRQPRRPARPSSRTPVVWNSTSRVGRRRCWRRGPSCCEGSSPGPEKRPPDRPAWPPAAGARTRSSQKGALDQGPLTRRTLLSPRRARGRRRRDGTRMASRRHPCRHDGGGAGSLQHARSVPIPAFWPPRLGGRALAHHQDRPSELHRSAGAANLRCAA